MRHKGWALWAVLLLAFIVFRHIRQSDLTVGTLVHAKERGVVMLAAGATIAPSEREWLSPFRLAMGRRISINSGTEAQLQTVPGIGPVRATRIAENRRSNGLFTGIEDLQRVRGIGPRTVEIVAPFVVR